MSKPKKHHYIPRMYLKGFCDDGNVWVYDRQKNSYEKRNPKTLATRRHFYSVVDSDSSKDPTVEHAIGSIEDAAAPVISKVSAGAMISMQEKFHLALFVSLMKFRVPMFENWFEQFSDAVGKKLISDRFQTVQDVQDQLDAWGKSDPTDPDQARSIFEGLQRPGYKIKPNAAARLKNMLELALGISHELSLMEWTFVEASKGASFITSDNPVLVLSSRVTSSPTEGWKASFDPYSLAGEGFASPGTRKIIPLTQRVCLKIGDYGTTITRSSFTRSDVRRINEEIAARCDRYLMARDEALLRRVSRKVPDYC